MKLHTAELSNQLSEKTSWRKLCK